MKVSSVKIPENKIEKAKTADVDIDLSSPIIIKKNIKSYWKINKISSKVSPIELTLVSGCFCLTEIAF